MDKDKIQEAISLLASSDVFKARKANAKAHGLVHANAVAAVPVQEHIEKRNKYTQVSEKVEGACGLNESSLSPRDVPVLVESDCSFTGAQTANKGSQVGIGAYHDDFSMRSARQTPHLPTHSHPTSQTNHNTIDVTKAGPKGLQSLLDDEKSFSTQLKESKENFAMLKDKRNDTNALIQKIGLSDLESEEHGADVEKSYKKKLAIHRLIYRHSEKMREEAKIEVKSAQDQEREAKWKQILWNHHMAVRKKEILKLNERRNIENAAKHAPHTTHSANGSGVLRRTTGRSIHNTIRQKNAGGINKREFIMRAKYSTLMFGLRVPEHVQQDPDKMHKDTIDVEDSIFLPPITDTDEGR